MHNLSFLQKTCIYIEKISHYTVYNVNNCNIFKEKSIILVFLYNIFQYNNKSYNMLPRNKNEL